MANAKKGVARKPRSTSSAAGKESALDSQVGGNHYKKYKVQPMELFHGNAIQGPEAFAIKYIMRHRDKDGAKDLDKAIHTLQMLKEMEYGK